MPLSSVDLTGCHSIVFSVLNILTHLTTFLPVGSLSYCDESNSIKLGDGVCDGTRARVHGSARETSTRTRPSNLIKKEIVNLGVHEGHMTCIDQ